MKAEGRPVAVRTIWSACVTTRFLLVFVFSLILYITGLRIAFFSPSISPWLDAQLGDLGYASVHSTVLWQNEYLPPHLCRWQRECTYTVVISVWSACVSTDGYLGFLMGRVE